MDNLIKFLRNNKIRQGEFAKAALMPDSRLSKLINGKGSLTGQNVADIIAASGGILKADDLLPPPNSKIKPVR